MDWAISKHLVEEAEDIRLFLFFVKESGSRHPIGKLVISAIKGHGALQILEFSVVVAASVTIRYHPAVRRCIGIKSIIVVTSPHII